MSISTSIVEERRFLLPPPKGFSLVELLIVVAIAAALMVVGVPGINSILRGSNLARATQMVVEEIQSARALAAARNVPVEVWLLADSNSQELRSVQSYLLNQDGSFTAASKPRHLPSGIGIANSAELSNIVAAQNFERIDAQAKDGIAIRISPSGRMELRNTGNFSIDPGDPHFLTLLPGTGSELEISEPPANFATIQINPSNSRVTTHRP